MAFNDLKYLILQASEAMEKYKSFCLARYELVTRLVLRISKFALGSRPEAHSYSYKVSFETKSKIH